MPVHKAIKKARATCSADNIWKRAKTSGIERAAPVEEEEPKPKKTIRKSWKMKPSAVEKKAADDFVKTRERSEAFKDATLELAKSKKARDLAGGTRSAGPNAQEILAEINKTLPEGVKPIER